jgi:hypothetical protein
MSISWNVLRRFGIATAALVALALALTVGSAGASGRHASECRRQHVRQVAVVQRQAGDHSPSAVRLVSTNSPG